MAVITENKDKQHNQILIYVNKVTTYELKEHNIFIIFFVRIHVLSLNEEVKTNIKKLNKK